MGLLPRHTISTWFFQPCHFLERDPFEIHLWLLKDNKINVVDIFQVLSSFLLSDYLHRLITDFNRETDFESPCVAKIFQGHPASLQVKLNNYRLREHYNILAMRGNEGIATFFFFLHSRRLGIFFSPTVFISVKKSQLRDSFLPQL